MKNIGVLFFHDFLFSLKNKSIFLVLFIPLFIFMAEQLLDKSRKESDHFKVAVIQTKTFPSRITQAFQAAAKNVEVLPAKDEEEGRQYLKERRVLGVLAESKPGAEELTLTVLRKDSPENLAILQFFSVLQRTSEKGPPNWISEMRSLQEGDLQKQTLPTWVLMLTLLIGLILLPSQVAEEKEKKLILALLQTPITEWQWLISKIILGIVLVMISLFVLCGLNQFEPKYFLSSIAFIALGAYAFSAFGIFLGFLCRHQAAARTMGFLFYLPLLLPSALGDFSKKLTMIAPFVPSYQFYGPLQGLFFGRGDPTPVLSAAVYLFVFGSIFVCLTYGLMKKRWLM